MSEYQDSTIPMPPVPSESTAPSETTPEAAPKPSMTDRASDAAGQGKQAASDVASAATDRARDVKEETARQARDLLGEARGHLSQQADEQHRNLVTNLRTLSNELGSMHSDQPGIASELVGQARTRVEGAADWLENRRPGDLVDEVRSFARRRPAVFLLGAAVAGVAVGRVTRGAVAAHSEDGGSTTPPISAPTGGQDEPTGDLYAVGATPTTPHDPSGPPVQTGYGTPPPVTGTPRQDFGGAQ